MTDLFSSLREWWRWRMRRTRTHIPGIVIFRMRGTVVAFDRGNWVIDSEDDRLVNVPSDHASAAGIRIGDSVEIEPMGLSGAIQAKLWIIVRKFDDGQH